MIQAAHRPLAIAALFAAASVALPAFAQPQIAPVTVTQAPTTVRISVLGKSPSTVYREVRHAAYVVCSNAVGNHELALSDHTFCADAASSKAMVQFAQIERARGFADSGLIVLSAR